MNYSKQSVCFILEASSRSGGVEVIFQYAEILAQDGYQVIFASLDPKPDWFKLDHRIEWNKYPNYEILTDSLVRVTRPNVVVATWWKTVYAAKSVQESTNCRAMYLVQDIETRYDITPLIQAEVMKTYDMGLEIITTSKWVLSQLPEAYYIGLGIHRMNVSGKVKRERMALACLRRQYLKGYRELVEVVNRLKAHHVRTQTFGVDLNVQIHEMHLPLRSHDNKAPTDRDVRAALERAAVFFSTSVHEGFSMTPIEAMATGTPVVMFAADGNMEYAVHGVNCLIATDPIDMVNKIVQVVTDRPLATLLSKNGKETAALYTWEKPKQRLLKLFESPLDNHVEGGVL